MFALVSLENTMALILCNTTDRPTGLPFEPPVGNALTGVAERRPRTPYDSQFRMHL